MLDDRHDLASGGILLDAFLPGRAWLPTGWEPDGVVERLQGYVARLLPPIPFEDPAWTRQLLSLDVHRHGVLVVLPVNHESASGPPALASLRELRFFRGPVVVLEAQRRRGFVNARGLKAVRRACAHVLPLATSGGVEPALYFRRQRSGVAPSPTSRARRLRASLRDVSNEGDGAPAVRLDPRVDNPIGWRQAPAGPAVRLHATDPLPNDIQRHVGVRLVTMNAAPVRVARQAARLAARGVPVAPDRVDAAWTSLLSSGLVELVAAASSALFYDPDARERHSVALRRAALRDHAPSLGRPTVSVLLVTRRTEFLAHALAQVRKQTYQSRELVLTLHDRGLAAAAARELRDCAEPQVTVRQVDPEAPFGTALAAATEAAQGEILMKMDDDDWYGACHLEDLVFALGYSGALLAGRARDFYYLAELDRTVRVGRRDDRFARQVHGGALAIRREHLMALGGWATSARGLVDSRLLDAVEREGELVMRLGGLGLLVSRRRSGHTWSPELAHFLKDPISQWRGLALEQAGIDG